MTPTIGAFVQYRDKTGHSYCEDCGVVRLKADHDAHLEIHK